VPDREYFSRRSDDSEIPYWKVKTEDRLQCAEWLYEDSDTAHYGAGTSLSVVRGIVCVYGTEGPVLTSHNLFSWTLSRDSSIHSISSHNNNIRHNNNNNNHIPKPVTEHENVTVLWNQGM
jgi:hypothetical protein